MSQHEASSDRGSDAQPDSADAVAQYRATLGMTEEHIRKRMLTQSKFSKEPTIALRIFELKKKESFGLPDEFAAEMAKLVALHEEAVGVHLRTKHAAAVVRAQHEAERFAALEAELLLQQSHKENTPPPKDEESSEKEHKKRKKKKNKRQGNTREEEAEDDSPAPKRAKQQSPLQEALSEQSVEEVLKEISRMYPPKPYVLLNVHKGTGVFPYDTFVLSGIDEKLLAQMDKEMSKKCKCSFNVLYWKGLIETHKQAHMTFSVGDMPAGFGAWSERFPDMDIRAVALRTLIWPQ